MRLMSHPPHGQGLKSSLNNLPSIETIEQLSLPNKEFDQRLEMLGKQCAMLDSLNRRQSLCVGDMPELLEVFKTEEMFLNSLPVTVMPSKTSLSQTMTYLFDKVYEELTKNASWVERAYSEVVPTIEQIKSQEGATPFVSKMLKTIANLAPRASVWAEQMTKEELVALASMSRTSLVGESITNIPLAVKLTNGEAVKGLMHDLANVSNLLQLVKSKNQGSIQTLEQRFSTLVACRQLLTGADALVQWGKHLNRLKAY